MTKVSELITGIRYILVDAPNLTEARGWSDERLLNLIDEAQKDICKETKIFKREHYLSLSLGSYTYPLPDDFIKADRFMDWERKIPEKSMCDMDTYRASWRTDVGDSVGAIIQDSVNMNQLEVYPIPSETLAYVPFYKAHITADLVEYFLYNVEGVTVDATNATFSSTLGVLTEYVEDITNVNVNVDVTPWGILTDRLTVTDSDGLGGNVTLVSYSDPVTGVVSNIERVDQYGIWGAVVGVNQAYGLLGGTWGVVASLATGNSVVKVRYSALTETLDDIGGQLTIPDKWATAIKYYVAGYALLDDNDAKNNEKGAAFTQRYTKDVSDLNGVGSSTDAARSATTYRALGKVDTSIQGDY